MATTARKDPWIHATWITGLLAGDDHCGWKAWFKAHFKFDRVERDFDIEAWRATHTDMVVARARELEADGWTVYLEDQNDFKLRGQTGITLSGKCDIIAVRGDDVLVVDCKSGRQRASDFQQVLVYMLAIPLRAQKEPAPPSFAAALHKRLAGELVYRERRVAIQPEEFTPALRGRILEMIGRVGSNTPLDRVPSEHECRFCDISAADCPQRIDAPQTVATTEAF
jgi:PD-(D/E)XK nuclease superfamily